MIMLELKENSNHLFSFVKSTRILTTIVINLQTYKLTFRTSDANGVLGSAKTGLKRVRGRQPRLERHVGVAWLYCYAAYKRSCAQLIPTSKP
jgi:hypothetical protein